MVQAGEKSVQELQDVQCCIQGKLGGSKVPETLASEAICRQQVMHGLHHLAAP